MDVDQPGPSSRPDVLLRSAAPGRGAQQHGAERKGQQWQQELTDQLAGILDPVKKQLAKLDPVLQDTRLKVGAVEGLVSLQDKLVQLQAKQAACRDKAVSQELLCPLVILGVEVSGKSFLASQLVAEFSKGRVPKVIEDLGDPSCLDWDYIPRPNALPGLQTDASALPALFDTSGLQGLEEFLREDDTFMLNYEELCVRLADEFMGNTFVPTSGDNVAITGVPTLFTGRVQPGQEAEIIITLTYKSLLEVENTIFELHEKVEAGNYSDQDFGQLKAMLGIDMGAHRRPALAHPPRLPMRMLKRLGHTVTVRTADVAAAKDCLLACTVGRWSNWGCLESVQVSVPADYEFAIMDLPGISQGSPYQAYLLQRYLETSEAHLFVFMGSRGREPVSEEMKTELQAHSRLMAQLANHKRLSKAYVVRCGSRDDDGILKQIKARVHCRGWDAGLKCFENWKELDKRRAWHTRLPDGVVRDWLMKNQPDEGSSSALQRRLAVFDNTKQDRFENHLLDVGNSVLSQGRFAEAAEFDVHRLSTFARGLQDQQKLKRQAAGDHLIAEALSILVDTFRLAATAVGANYLQESPQASKLLQKVANNLQSQLKESRAQGIPVYSTEQAGRQTRADMPGLPQTSCDLNAKEGLDALKEELDRLADAQAASCTEEAANLRLDSQGCFEDGRHPLKEMYWKKSSHTFLRHLRSLHPLKETPLPTILMEPVLTALPLDLMGEVGDRFAAFADHRVGAVKTWCQRLVDASKGAADDVHDLEDGAKHSIKAVLDSMVTQLRTHLVGAVTTATDKLRDMSHAIETSGMHEILEYEMVNFMGEIEKGKGNSLDKLKKLLESAPDRAMRAATALVDTVIYEVQDIVGAFEKEVRQGVSLAAMMLQSKDVLRAAGQAARLGLQEHLQQATFKRVCLDLAPILTRFELLLESGDSDQVVRQAWQVQDEPEAFFLGPSLEDALENLSEADTDSDGEVPTCQPYKRPKKDPIDRRCPALKKLRGKKGGTYVCNSSVRGKDKEYCSKRCRVRSTLSDNARDIAANAQRSREKKRAEDAAAAAG